MTDETHAPSFRERGGSPALRKRERFPRRREDLSRFIDDLAERRRPLR